MKIFDYKANGVSKKFLYAASAYRRNAKDRELNFSLESLIEQYKYESFGGEEPDPYINGYTCGKWIMDATLKMIEEDLYKGNACKNEFKSCPSLMRRIIKGYAATPLFGYGK